MTEEERLMTCEICKGNMVLELQDYVVEWEGAELLVEDVPIWVCQQCGYTQMEEDVAEAVEDMLAHMDTVVTDQEEE